MKLRVKPLAIITISIFTSLSLTAQLKLPTANTIAPDIRKVVEDYPNQFRNLSGALIIEHPQSSDYECNFVVRGSEQSTITRYPSKQGISSWQALMLTTEDFDSAKSRFRNLFTQLNNLSVNISGSVYHLKGVYDTPKEESKFTSVLFDFGKDDEAIKKLRVELVMSYEPMEWKVKVLVYDREREDNERGPRTED